MYVWISTWDVLKENLVMDYNLMVCRIKIDYFDPDIEVDPVFLDFYLVVLS